MVVELLSKYSNGGDLHVRVRKAWSAAQSVDLCVVSSTEPQVRKARHRLLPHAEVTSILDQYAAGASSREVASAHGVSKSKVITVLKQNGALVRQRATITEQVLDEATRLYAAGLTLPEVAAAVGVSLSALNRAFVTLGIPRRGRWGT